MQEALKCVLPPLDSDADSDSGDEELLAPRRLFTDDVEAAAPVEEIIVYADEASLENEVGSQNKTLSIIIVYIKITILMTIYFLGHDRFRGSSYRHGSGLCRTRSCHIPPF